jgi:RNA polymerase sigma factor (sigma-70 family)
MPESLDTWFSREILPYEGSLLRYLARVWQHRDDTYDLCHEVYVRVYEAAANTRPLAPRSFLFATAHNLMVDRIRRSRVVSIEPWAELENPNVLIDEISAERQASAHEELRTLARAFELLPPRCRQVVWMRRVEGLSQRQVAARLGIGEAMVEKHLAKAMRRLADVFFGSGATDSFSLRKAGKKRKEGRESTPNSDDDLRSG